MQNAFYLFGGKSRIPLCRELMSASEFQRYLGMSDAELKKITWYSSRMYTEFDISKKSGKKRRINAPDIRLKMLQRKIASVLDGIYQPRNSVHGFVAGRSVKSNAETHLLRRYVLNVDLKDFFPTITKQRIRGLLNRLGIDPAVSSIISHLSCLNGCLPQGAPSSPVLSNMICFALDKSIIEFAKKHSLLYTRYADDITLSSFRPPLAVFNGSAPLPGKLAQENLSVELVGIIESSGFTLNKEKIHYADKNSRRIVTGIKVNDGLNLDRKYIRNIRATLFKVEKVGIPAAQTELNSRLGAPVGLQPYLQGKISWVGFVKGQSDPVFRNLATRYNLSFKTNKIKVTPTPREVLDRAVWVLETENSNGTAFFLKGVGLVTAAHCVNGEKTIEIFHPGKTSNKFKVEVAHICTNRDLALLRHSIPSTEYFELFEFAGNPNVGDETVAAGFPNYGPGDKLNVRLGTISSFTVKHAIPLIEVTQKLSQGMSGGPVMTTDNGVIGVVHKGGPEEPRDFAVKIDVLKQWLLTLGSPINPTTSPTPPPHTAP